MSDDAPRGPVSVAALVDLYRHEHAGGHVKVWERFAEAAAAFPRRVDLTVYFLGDDEQEIVLAPNARCRTVAAAFGTRRLPFLRQGGGDTDLARYNRRLAERLPQHDLLHITSPFCFAWTAIRVARTLGKPLVASTHTDVAAIAPIYTREAVINALGHGAVGRLILDGMRLPALSGAILRRVQDAAFKHSDHVLVSSRHDWNHVRESWPRKPLSFLRRGIDTRLFSPSLRDRTWLQQTYDIAPGTPVALFAGRVDETKRVLTCARAVQRVIERGTPLQVLIAGAGSQEDAVRELLGDAVVLAGTLSQDDLARAMASADVFVFPSETEVAGNSVIEAMASGLPVFVSAHSSVAPYVTMPGENGFVLLDRSPEALAEALAGLLDDEPRRQAVGAAARQRIERDWPTWEAVVEQDLLPVWEAAAGRARGALRPAVLTAGADRQRW